MEVKGAPGEVLRGKIYIRFRIESQQISLILLLNLGRYTEVDCIILARLYTGRCHWKKKKKYQYYIKTNFAYKAY